MDTTLEPTTVLSTSTSTSTSKDSADAWKNPTVDGKFAVDDAGRQLAIVCWGVGSPTVILETGGPNIEEWTGSGVVQELAPRTRTCTYARAGTGESDPPAFERRDAENVVNDLHGLLAAAEVDGPYVLLGRSFGGMIVTHYAETFPDGVVGVIVLDTPAPDATFTEESEPELVWDYEGNTERLDVVGGFENRFANDPPQFDAPLLLITPVPGEATVDNEAFWLQVSSASRQLVLNCGDEPTEGPCATSVMEFVDSVTD